MPIVFFGLLFFALELSVLIEVGSQLGTVTTLLLILGSAFLGINIMTRQGPQVLRNAQVAAAEGRSPARDLVEAVLVVLAGLLLFIPGFISDAVGLLLLTPLRGLLAATTVGSWVAQHAPASPSWNMNRGPFGGADPHKDQTIIEAEFKSVDDEK